jgi:hypothetical protein
MGLYFAFQIAVHDRPKRRNCALAITLRYDVRV